MSETRRSNIIVVTGTDTAVGKTWVTAALANALAGLGATVRAVKLVETGCARTSHDREDGVVLARATGQDAPVEALYRFPDDVSPALAAERAGTPVDFDELLMAVERYAEKCDLLLLEGSGGLLAPITWEWCVVDVAQALDARAIVVASDRLGTLSPALLTLGALELAAVPVVEVVLTPPATPDETAGTNAAAIRRLSGAQQVTSVPRTDDPAMAAASLLETARRLLAGH